ncbi:hypothetical protein PAMC26510_27845 [Caballeronia sordidicola]|uniref:Uncharacterized protein n=1 Tax=Caballeronia sordidicola TaxID=196367 RepID=A0A242ME62_CABSO|nr:hypothetical protein PAMC26510_27845 [Caballeronia sordidicola]
MQQRLQIDCKWFEPHDAWGPSPTLHEKKRRALPRRRFG